eukprot:1668046-Pyramimonas_sp.AAC.1
MKVIRGHTPKAPPTVIRMKTCRSTNAPGQNAENVGSQMGARGTLHCAQSSPQTEHILESCCN